MRLKHYERCDLDQKVGIFAIENDAVIGTNFFYFCPLAVNGKIVECVVSNNLFVAPEYRPKGIGTFLKMYVLKLGYPQISSGVSPSMQKVYDAWSAYTKIDASPVYAIPVTPFGLLRVARMASEKNASVRKGRLEVLTKAMRRGLAVLSARKAGNAHITLQHPRRAEELMDQVLRSERYPIQVPWNRDVVTRALRGENTRVHAWMASIKDENGIEVIHLISGYLRPMQVRGIGTEQRRIQELHLTEIFPPVRSESIARACLSIVVKRAAALGASIIQVYAMTSALQAVCDAAGFDSFFKKRVYVAPNTKDKTIDAFFRNPDNWWCRIRNEDQLEENAFRREGASQNGSSQFFSTQMIY
jgi:hypothetical protein